MIAPWEKRLGIERGIDGIEKQASFFYNNIPEHLP
jgi:hypothetical protein